MSKIIELLQNFITSILCNTVRRFAAKRSREIGTNLVESYIYVLQERLSAIETQDGIHNHISEFSTYCAAFGQHMTYEELIREVTCAFCPVGVVKQLGQPRNQIISRNIFVNTFKESASMLMRTSEILDMVANGADDAVAPCQKIVKAVINNLKTELMTGGINAVSQSNSVTTTVSSKMYDTTKQKYDLLVSAYHKKDLDLMNAVKKIKELAEYLKKINMENQSLRARMREIESRPKELFVSRPEPTEEILEPSVPAVVEEPKDISVDDSVSCCKGPADHRFVGSIASYEDTPTKKRSKKSTTKSTTRSETKKSTAASESIFADENDFNPDDLDSFF